MKPSHLAVEPNRSDLPYATTTESSTTLSRRASPIDPTPPTPSTKSNFYSIQQPPSFHNATALDSPLPPRPLDESHDQSSATSYADGEEERPGAESQISHYQTPNSSLDEHDPYMRGYSPQAIKEAREDTEGRVEKRAPAESMFIQVGEKQFHFDRLTFNVEDGADQERNSTESNDTLLFQAMIQSHHDSYPYLESGPPSPASPRMPISNDYYSQQQQRIPQSSQGAAYDGVVPLSPTNASDYGEGTVRGDPRATMTSIIAEKGSNSWTREDDDSYRLAVEQRFSYISPSAAGIPPSQTQFDSPPPSPTIANQLMRPPPTRINDTAANYNYPQGYRHHQDSREGFYLPYESRDRQLRERPRSISSGGETGRSRGEDRALPSAPRGAVEGYSFVNLNRGFKTNNKFDSSKELHSSPLAKSDNALYYADVDSHEGTPTKSGFFKEGLHRRYSKKLILITLGLIAILLGIIVGVVLGVEKGKQSASGNLQADSTGRGNGNGSVAGLASIGTTTLPGGSVRIITLERTVALTATNVLTKPIQTAVVTTTATSTLLPPPSNDNRPPNDARDPPSRSVSPSAIASIPSPTAPSRLAPPPVDAPTPTTSPRASAPTAAPSPPRQTVTQTICSYDGVTILGLRIGAFTTTLGPGDRAPFASECTTAVRVSPRANRVRARRLH